MPSVLDEHLKKHRKRLIDREEAAFREILAAYEEVRRELRRQVLILQKKIRDAQAAGEEISPAWFARERRLELLIDQVKTQIDRFGNVAANVTQREQMAAIEIAVSQARETISLLVSGEQGAVSRQIGTLVNPRVVENAVGMMGDGSPILEYYRKKLAPAVAEAIRKEVIQAAAMGTDFRTIGRRLEAAGDITRSRALMVARTEVNRVRRETTRQFFENNGIEQWEWVSAKSARTCPACLALDGTVYDTDQVFPQHPNCRCTLIAVIKDFPRPARQTGSEWFESAPDEIQEQVLGRDAFDSFKRGEVELKDFVGWRNSKEFGRSVYTRPLSAVLLNKK